MCPGGGLAVCLHASTLKPVVEAEEEVYTYTDANNGAGPLWCAGSTCLVRSGREVFASGLETLHLLWTERAIDERLRDRFFPDAQQVQSMIYAVVRGGRISLQRTLFEMREGEAGEIATEGRFQVAPQGRLFLSFLASGNGVSENRICEVLRGGVLTQPVRIPLKHPFAPYTH